MGIATRRSQIACNRMGFDPMDNELCCGIIEDRQQCPRQIPLSVREKVFFMVGQGAHLFSDAGELRGILTEAADLLYCSPGHRDSDELVGRWIENWRVRQKTDLEIRALIDARVREREHEKVNKKWRVAFENHIGQIVRSDISDGQRVREVKRAIWQDQYEETAGPQPAQAPDSRLMPRYVFPRAEAFHFRGSIQRQRASSTTRSSLLPALSDLAYSEFSLPEDIRRARSSTTQSQAAQLPSNDTLSAPRDDSAPQTLTADPTPVSRRSRSRSVATGGRLSEMHVFFRNMTQRFSASATSPPSTTSLALPTVQTVPSLSSTPLNEAQTEAREQMSPLSQTAPMRDEASTLAATPQLTGTAVPFGCDICTLPLTNDDPCSVWTCPDCVNELHMSCLQEWNLQNIRLMRQPTCPYCRSVIRRPANL